MDKNKAENCHCCQIAVTYEEKKKTLLWASENQPSRIKIVIIFILYEREEKFSPDRHFKWKRQKGNESQMQVEIIKDSEDS